ncbi:Basic helix-loop-helix transcription factor [Quillaja saponaria]|uniref:Basic helix-loop-helix transcription factor n=1 Tax=Quillaja saponaria TaxID=32244 RepID=A0AAD7L4B3_QUISA|nr:Basic helix-loop-helix transcription factor [Quillaja saponaria]
MPTESQEHGRMPKNLRTRLAVSVRSIQWSYAVFWSPSTTKQGGLEWGDGYYNGDIKKRKMVQAKELKADKIGLQRSDQLRELYKVLQEGEIDQQPKRPSIALSPEDLTDAEWYYLVCMSFVFNQSQSLPGKALASGETIWLCNAQYADSKVFSRSLLAKTVVCFPYLGGIVEIGTTELVAEDPNLLQHIKACLLDCSKPVCSDKSTSTLYKADDDKDPTCIKIDYERVDTLASENLCPPTEEIRCDQDLSKELHGIINEESNMDSHDECSDGCEHHCQTEDSFMLGGVDSGDSHVHLMDDAISKDAEDSMHSSDCISEAVVNKNKTNENMSHIHLRELQDCNHSKLISSGLGTDDDFHYKRTLSDILRNSSLLIENPYHVSFCKSNFQSWNEGGNLERQSPVLQQNMLKKILFTVPLMHSGVSYFNSFGKKGNIERPRKLESKEYCVNHTLPDNRREAENSVALKSMVPSITEKDMTSILGDTIKYLKELEARVEELESCTDFAEIETRSRRKYLDMVEQISDNYDNKMKHNGKKPWINKRKACDINELDLELNRKVPKEGLPLDVKVKMKEQEVLIEMKCPYREYILLDIMDAINNMHLDAHTVQSSTQDGVLTLTLKSKFRGAATAPVGMIKEALMKVGSC